MAKYMTVMTHNVYHAIYYGVLRKGAPSYNSSASGFRWGALSRRPSRRRTRPMAPPRAQWGFPSSSLAGRGRTCIHILRHVNVYEMDYLLCT